MECGRHSKRSHKPSYYRIIMKQFTFTSSAIEGLSMEGDQVSVTFHGGREYTYKAVDPTTFETALNGEIADPEGSVGRLVNQLIRSEDLVTV